MGGGTYDGVVGNVLTVTSIAQGIVPGTTHSKVTSPTLTGAEYSNTFISSQTSGATNGVGVYALTQSNAVAPGTLNSAIEHGDPQFANFSGANVQGYMDISYNTEVLNSNEYGGTSMLTRNQATYSGQTLTNGNFVGNVFISNAAPLLYPAADDATCGSIIAGDAGLNYTNTNMSGNWVDPSGCFYFSFYSAQAGSAVPTVSGNVNLLGNGSGGPDSTFNTWIGSSFPYYITGYGVK
jgi:hypothetical protein